MNTDATEKKISGGGGTGLIINNGHNSFGGTSSVGTNGFTGNWQVMGPQVVSAKGTGVCTSSQTLFLFPAGQIAATTCTGTTESQLTGTGVVTRTGTLANLRCKSTAGGFNASSGVVTVRKNGANTTTTATFGTALTANDSVHTSAVTLGDIITFSLTTQATETLAGVSCQVQVN